MASKTDNAINGGMNGAQMGGQIGGGWGALIGGIIGAAWGYFTPDYEARAIKKYNDEVVRNAMQDLFDLRRVQNVQNMQTAQALAAYQTNNTVQASTFNATYGATETIGASAQALRQVMDFQTQQAMAQTWTNWETGVEEHNTEVRRITNAADAGLRRQRGSTNQVDYGGLVKSGMDMYSKYKGTGTTTTVSTTNTSAFGTSQGTFFDSFKGVGGGGQGGGAMTA